MIKDLIKSVKIKLTNKMNLPLAIKRAVENDPYNPSGSDISTTRLIAPPLIRYLEVKHKDEIEEDVADRIWALLGSSVHHVIERAKIEKDLSEIRLFYKDDDITNGWTLSGQFDYITEDGELIDFKVTSAWSALDALQNGKDEWEEQLNILHFLAKHNPDKVNIKINKLYIVAILRDWSKLQASKSDNYPQAQVVKIPIRLWSNEEQEHFIRERIRLHQQADIKEPDICSPKERWRKEDSFAVMKDGRKSALRVLPTLNAAKEYLKEKNMQEGKGCLIVHRAGKDVRCADYCRVNKWCKHFNDTIF